MVNFQDFKNLDIRVAEIKEVKEIPNADKLYILKIDIGGEEREIVAGIKKHYKPDELMGKKIVVLANLEPAVIRGVQSNGMLLAASDNSREKIVILTPEKDMAPGSRIS